MGLFRSTVRRRPDAVRGVPRAGTAVLAVAAAAASLLAAGTAGAAAPPPGYDPADPGSPESVARMIGADRARAAGWTGAGVDVAVVDTGIAPVGPFATPGTVVTGPDLSLDAPQAQVPGLDAYGHGTFMAGLVHDVAPGARLVNVRVGAYDGAVDVTQVIAAIDWVVQHARDPGLNIRVINLSYGTQSDQKYEVDPLAHAVENARRRGILVVAAAGNDGKPTKDLAAPAYDPFVLAAGGDDPNGTVDVADDEVPSFAQHGTVHRPVDVIAPATHLVGLRVPGSYVDLLPDNPGRVGEAHQRGSGTSQAAALVSGAAALLFEKHPQASPDTVKALLTATARPVLRGRGRPAAPGQMLYSGHGIVDVAAALAATPATAAQTWRPSSGTGSLDATRGGQTVGDPVPLQGERDIFGRPVDTAALAAQRTGAGTWTGGWWNGSRWSGDGWEGTTWQSTVWTGSRWSGASWTGSRWSDMTWTGSRWSGSGWNGSRWSGSRWSGSRWSGSRWSEWSLS